MEPQINRILNIILGQWTLAILWILHRQGSTRFNKLKRQLDGVTPKVLTARLRMLEQQQIIVRTVKPAKIPEVSYQISPKGQKLIPILESLQMVSHGWSEEQKGSVTTTSPIAHASQEITSSFPFSSGLFKIQEEGF